MAIRVNGVEIPESAIQFELDRLVKFYSQHMSPEQIREQMDALRARAREQAVGARLLMAEAQRLDLMVPPEDVTARFLVVVRQAGGEEAFEKLLARQKISRELVRSSIEQGMRVDRLIEKATEGLSDPTEEEIRAHFEAHQAEYVKPDRAQASHILIKPASGAEADKQVALSRLMEIRRRIAEGANFADEAAAHSECPSGRKTGGSLGWVSRGMMLPELDAAVFSMDVGILSEVIESPLGLHIVRKTAEERGGDADFDDVRERIRDFLRHVARGEAISAYVADLRKKADIEED